MADLGKIDIVVANAGILPMAMGRTFDPMHFVDATDVDLLGVMNTVAVAAAPPAERRVGHHHRFDRGHDPGHHRQPEDGPGRRRLRLEQAGADRVRRADVVCSWRRR